MNADARTIQGSQCHVSQVLTQKNSAYNYLINHAADADLDVLIILLTFSRVCFTK